MHNISIFWTVVPFTEHSGLLSPATGCWHAGLDCGCAEGDLALVHDHAPFIVYDVQQSQILFIMSNDISLSNLSAMVAFATIVDTGSFSGAAKLLGCSKAAISRQIARLEETNGVRLLHRTTRKVTPTPAGNEYYTRCARIVDEVNEANQLMAGMVSAPRGELNVNAPVVFTLFHTKKLITEFIKRYPEVKVNLSLSDNKVDLLKEGFDVVFWLGEPYDSTLDSVKLGAFDMIVCGSPKYFKEHGEPDDPTALKKHECIIETHLSRPGEWRLSESVTVKVRGRRLVTNSVRIARDSVLEGIGIAFLPSFIVDEDIRKGRLKVVLTDFVDMQLPMHVIFPKSQYLLAKVRVFIDFLSEVMPNHAGNNPTLS